MLSRRGFILSAAGSLLVGGTARWSFAQAAPTITVYKSRTCGCCTEWVEHLRDNGFSPTARNEEQMDQLKDELGIPQALRSCHTAIVGQYLIEGHVPAADIRRLLAERPKAAGLAVPGMPSGSPGMAQPGDPEGGYDVLAFQSNGSTRVFASH
jgi:hypothetical protein